MVQDWEAKNGALKAGEVVLFYSEYSDKYYKPFPEGNRLAFDPLILGTKPGWPAPSPETIEYLQPAFRAPEGRSGSMPPAACAASFIRERRRNSSNGSVVSIRLRDGIRDVKRHRQRVGAGGA
jgi:hypothetical protein